MYNTIRLLRGEERLSYSEFKKFQRGDTIFGVDSDPTEIKRWSIDDKDKAKAELSKYQCSCSRGICISIANVTKMENLYPVATIL